MVCPVCTVAIAGGVGLLRVLGVDDIISGLWVGGLVLSMSLWLVDWLRKKKVSFRYDTFIITAVMYALTIVPMYYSGMIGSVAYNRIFGFDKLLVGIVSGSFVFLCGVGFDRYLRSINGGKVVFFYQKVVLPVSFMVIASMIIQLTLMILY
jgi:hypothetical protein